MTAILLAVLIVLTGAGCQKSPPEEAIRGAISQMQAAAEARDMGSVLNPVAADFVGPQGMDRKAFRQTLALVSLRNENIAVDLGPMDITLLGDRATASFTAATRGGSGGLLPDHAQVYRVETGWRLDGGDWKMISAKWEPAL